MVGVGTETYTVGSIIDRLYLSYLTPPGAQDPMCQLAASVTLPTQQTIVLGSFVVPEDSALVRMGSLIEIDQEVMRITGWDADTSTATVDRGVYSTVATTHLTPKMVHFPQFPRSTVFEAVADNILTLHPSLFTISTVLLNPAGYKVYRLNDNLAVDVKEVWPDGETQNVDLHAKVVDYHEAAGGRALLTNQYTGNVWARLVRRMGKATSEDDTLTEVGMDERWVNVVMAGAAADVMAGRDIPAAQTEWVKSVLEAENIRVGTRMSIAGGLRQYRAILLREARKEMKAEYRTSVHMRKAKAQFT
jgi:hypothetical protein